MNKEFQIIRTETQRSIEFFLEKKGFYQAEVPLLTQFTIPENHLSLFETEQKSPYKNPYKKYLTPSPEVYLKPLIALNQERIYCISRAFRNSEQIGKHHSPEFTMLEYYLTEGNYIDSLKLTKELFKFLIKKNRRKINSSIFSKKLKKKQPSPSFAKAIKSTWIEISIEEAFFKYAGFSLKKAVETNQFKNETEKIGLSPSQNSTTEELFNLVMVAKIEEALPQNKIIILKDYPSFVPTTAKLGKNPFWSERWELYFNGIEIANCYTEKDSEIEMKEYIHSEKNKPISKEEIKYCQQFKKLPKCSGTAIGFERLLMALYDIEEIKNLFFFQNHIPILS